MVRDRLAVILFAIGNQRITVVGPFLDQIEFVAVLGAHLMRPELAIGSECHSQNVAMAERPDLRRYLTLISEGVVLGHAAIVVQPHHLAQIAVHILGRVKLLPLTGADPQHTVAIERETMAEMAVAGYLRRLPPDHLQVLERAPTIFIQHQTGPRHRSAGATIASLGITDVDLLVVRSEEHTSELQSRENLVCRLLLEKKKTAD